jgi:hypothetical protein
MEGVVAPFDQRWLCAFGSLAVSVTEPPAQNRAGPDAVTSTGPRV